MIVSDMRECVDTANELLSWYLNGTLQPGERATVETHLIGCAVCRRELAELSELAEAMSLHSESPAAPRPQAARPGLASFPAALGWAAAASVILIAALAFVVLRQTGPFPSAGSEAGESVALDLGSGPTRGADSPAALRISGKTRSVELSFVPPIDARNDYEVRLVGPDQVEIQSWERGPLALDQLGRARLTIEAPRLARAGDYQLFVRHLGDAGEISEHVFPFTVASVPPR